MEYNDFLRIYYNEMINNFKSYDLLPRQIFVIDNQESNMQFYEQKDCGWFGTFGIKLGAPNEEYEKFFETYSEKYPEFIHLFVGDRQELLEMSSMVSNVEEIKLFLKELKMIYEQMGLIELENNVGQ